MNKKAIRAEVESRLSLGDSKTSTFRELSGKGVSDRVLAHLIASHASPARCMQHAKLIDAMIVLSWLQLALVVVLSVIMGWRHGFMATLIAAVLLGGLVYPFVWGFTRNRAWAYNVTILLSILNLPQCLKGIDSNPVGSAASLAITVGTIGFTWYVRSKVFPDFAFFSARKAKGAYVFSS